MSLKAMSFVSSMRSNLALLSRSPNVRSAEIAAVRSDVLSYLANKVLIYPPSLLSLGVSPDMSFQDRKSALGIKSASSVMSAYELEFSEHLESAARRSRRSNWIWRVGAECEAMRDKGWFPFFVTLTVDPSRCSDSEQMWKDGVEFDRYLTRLARVSAKAGGHPSAIKDGVSRCQFVRHVGVIEHGKSRHHHHMHIMIWMRDVPEAWKICPNRGNPNPASRTTNFCRSMSTYWPLALPGLGRAIYFRHEGDIWSRLGFCVPVNRVTRRPITVLPCRLAGIYVAKYMDKGDKAWLHRVKATRNLGIERLREILFQISLGRLEALTHRPRKFAQSVLLQTIHSVPHGLLRSLAKQVLFCRRWDGRSLDFQKLLRPSSAPFIEMLKSVRDGQRPSLMCSAEFYDWVTSHLPVPDGYCERALSSAHLQLSIEFPPQRHSRVSHLGGLSRE